jgi:hypothetical protein
VFSYKKGFKDSLKVQDLGKSSMLKRIICNLISNQFIIIDIEIVLIDILVETQRRIIKNEDK